MLALLGARWFVVVLTHQSVRERTQWCNAEVAAAVALACDGDGEKKKRKMARVLMWLLAVKKRR